MDASSTKKNILLSYRRNLTKSHVHRLTKTQAATRTKRGPIEASEDDGRSKKGGKPQNDSSLTQLLLNKSRSLLPMLSKLD